mmetsp:Transcript_9705/g.17232  ORF Transcript_9705/g.17232 Transcript_9705/m.17232 type:complete len:205 (+) Transcript_9705:681-1295(+)
MCSISWSLFNPISLIPTINIFSKLFASFAALATTHLPFALSMAKHSEIIRKLSSREKVSLSSKGASTTSVTLTIPKAQVASGSLFHSGTTNRVYANVVALSFNNSSAAFKASPPTLCAPLTKMTTFLTLSAASAASTISLNLLISPPPTWATHDETSANCSTVGDDAPSVKSSLSNSPVYLALRPMSLFFATFISSTWATILVN